MDDRFGRSSSFFEPGRGIIVVIRLTNGRNKSLKMCSSKSEEMSTYVFFIFSLYEYVTSIKSVFFSSTSL